MEEASTAAKNIYRKEKILSMICPFCKEKMINKKIISFGRSGPGERRNVFQCHNCPYVFSELWLNDPRFGQFENFVTRSEDKIEEIWNRG